MDDCVSENDLIEYVHGLSSAAARRRVEVHIDRCVACRRLVSELAAELTTGSRATPTQEEQPAIALPVPARVGRYLVLDRLGVGGMGVVHAAYDPKLDRKVALKLIRGARSTAGDDPELLLREAQAQGRLAHPNVVAIHDVGFVDGQVWLAMEFIAGPTARAWLEARPRRLREVLAVLRAAGEGLAAVHAAGLVHRDFKPVNVMIGEDGRARLMDFGLAGGQARAAARDVSTLAITAWQTRLTHTGVLLGTPAYMAPEQWRGEPADARTDQFAYCVVLWEALCGERPFAGDDAGALADNVLAGRRRRARADVPGWLRRALERGLAVDPSRRWPSMRALLDALDAGVIRRRVSLGAGLLCGSLALTWGAVAGLARWDAAERTRTCAALAGEVAALWDDGAEAAVREAFAATKVVHAATTADRVVAALDEFVAAWSTARGEACVRRELDPTWTRATADEAEACLLAARWSLQDLLTELGAADADTVQRATAAALGLTAPPRCLDPRWLAARPQAPDGPQRERSEQARRGLVRAASLYAAGRYGESLALARDLVAAADQLGWPPLAARARLAVGAAAKVLGDAAAAERALEDGFFLALRGGDPTTATLAASKLASTVAFDLRRPAEGIRWGRWGEALLARDADAWSTAVLLDNLGAAHLAAEDFAAAQALFERAVAATEASLGPYHPDVANARTNLGRALTARGAGEQALREHQRAVAIASVALGPDHPDLALFLDGLAGALGNMGEHAAALAVYHHALAIADAGLTRDDGLIAALTSNTGWTLRALGRVAEARALHERALAAIARQSGPGHPDVAREWNNIGDCHFTEGSIEAAADAYARALAIFAAASGPDHSDVALTQIRLGHVARARGDLDASLTTLTAAAATLEARLGAHHPDLAIAHQAIGETQLARGQLDEAGAAYGRALTIWEAAAGADSPNTAYARVGLGQVALARDSPAGAAAPLRRVLELCADGDCPADVVAAAEFGLARAILTAEPARARELAAAAEARLIAAHLTRTPELAALRRWRRDHP